LADYVRADDSVIVDVGAHSGLFAAFAVERAPAAMVTCIEPDPQMAGIIERNLSGSKWRLVQAAASAEKGTSKFFRSAKSTQTSSLLKDAVLTFDQSPEELTVQTVTLDEVCADLDHVDVLKIDVQGSEASVLRGAADTLARTRTVLIEVSLNDEDPVGVLTLLADIFGPWKVLNPVFMGADVVFERSS
jgi:FkbM family methyltransferase